MKIANGLAPAFSLIVYSFLKLLRNLSTTLHVVLVMDSNLKTRLKALISGSPSKFPFKWFTTYTDCKVSLPLYSSFLGIYQSLVKEFVKVRRASSVVWIAGPPDLECFLSEHEQLLKSDWFWLVFFLPCLCCDFPAFWFLKWLCFTSSRLFDTTPSNNCCYTCSWTVSLWRIFFFATSSIKSRSSCRCSGNFLSGMPTTRWSRIISDFKSP